jgi:hypothetical protein
VQAVRHDTLSRGWFHGVHTVFFFGQAGQAAAAHVIELYVQQITPLADIFLPNRQIAEIAVPAASGQLARRPENLRLSTQ